jgi:hypothetical protein
VTSATLKVGLTTMVIGAISIMLVALFAVVCLVTVLVAISAFGP